MRGSAVANHRLSLNDKFCFMLISVSECRVSELKRREAAQGADIRNCLLARTLVVGFTVCSRELIEDTHLDLIVLKHGLLGADTIFKIERGLLVRRARNFCNQLLQRLKSRARRRECLLGHRLKKRGGAPVSLKLRLLRGRERRNLLRCQDGVRADEALNRGGERLIGAAGPLQYCTEPRPVGGKVIAVLP